MEWFCQNVSKHVTAFHILNFNFPFIYSIFYIKISNINDKKTKIADLMTTLRLKDKAISKVTANQTNHIHITDKRNLIESLTKYKKEKKEITNG